MWQPNSILKRLLYWKIKEQANVEQKFNLEKITYGATWHIHANTTCHKLALSLIVLLVCAAISAFIRLAVKYFSKNNHLLYKRIHFDLLFDRNVRTKFKSQRVETMVTILHGVRAALCDYCTRPSVLMLLATDDSYATSVNLSKRVCLAFLAAQGSFPDADGLRKITMKGSKYQALEDYWKFYQGLSKRLARFKVAIISDYHRIHPQASSALCHFADDAFSPYPKTLIFLLANVGGFFTEREIQTRSVMEMAESYTSHEMIRFLDSTVVADLQRTICGRPAFIEP
ncbi:Hypothetical protein NTJ_02273 [Nesidiocoris tenuis]|uniref:Uncharacterized protein n=1 Tax=Nesidiocoris tenuis TaxID=355587 RepID=A0ABN7AAW6_9HEMI|nr:Hypothetical protein NTJ_02273 [Nesidiocoris tenuis]